MFVQSESAHFLLDKGEALISKGIMHGGDGLLSLFEGPSGLSVLRHGFTFRS